MVLSITLSSPVRLTAWALAPITKEEVAEVEEVDEDDAVVLSGAEDGTPAERVAVGAAVLWLHNIINSFYSLLHFKAFVCGSDVLSLFSLAVAFDCSFDGVLWS